MARTVAGKRWRYSTVSSRYASARNTPSVLMTISLILSARFITLLRDCPGEKQQPKPVNGIPELSDRPGLGIELDESKIEDIRPVSWQQTCVEKISKSDI